MDKNFITRIKEKIFLKNENHTVESKGIHIISICDARSERAEKLQILIEECRLKRAFLINKFGGLTERMAKELWDEYQYFMKCLHSEFLLRQFVVENITTTAGRSVSAQRLAAVNTYTGNVNYTALGSSATAEVIGNTQLGTEVYRKALSSGTALNNISYLETFFTATETSGTYQEYGMFIDGSGTANSGQLFNRFTSAVVKSTVETLNVQSQVTWSDA